MNLSEIIIQKIETEGPLDFREFMEMCLYYPGLGYYNSAANKIGVLGDFYTSPCLTSVFGALIGKQLEEMWCQLGNPEFTIVEYGAGTGKLCYDILNYLKSNRAMYTQLRYCIIEKSPIMRDAEKQFLTEKVEWYDSIGEIKELTGCVLSNELIDNFAVHQVIQDKELMEIFVDYRNGFVEILKPASDELKRYLEVLEINLPEHYRTEVNLEAVNWISEIATALKRGYIMTIDYGCLSSELYKPCKSSGTLMSYSKHTVNDSFYEHIGEQDITAHVNFSALMYWGEKNGLRTLGYTEQGKFLLALGFQTYLQHILSQEIDVIKAAIKANRLTQIMLLDMGTKFKFLLQEKGVSTSKLCGFA